MRRKKIIAVILFLLLIITSGFIWYLNDKGPFDKLSDLEYEKKYIVDMDRNFTTSQEEIALNISEKLPYGELLGSSRYIGGDDLGEHGSEFLYIDKQVIQDGIGYVDGFESSRQRGIFVFEYKASSQYLENFTIEIQIGEVETTFRMKLDHSDILVLDSHWADHPPFEAILTTEEVDDHQFEEGQVYYDERIDITEIHHSTNITFEKVYFTQMLVEIGSSIPEWGMGNGWIDHQYVVLDEWFEPILIVSLPSEWVA